MKQNEARALILYILLIALPIFVQAQNICAPNQPASDSCGGACVRCNLNGYVGLTFDYNSNAAPGFCDALEHDQWIGFVAPVDQTVIQITPFNCSLGHGVQGAIYENCGQDPIVCNAGQDGGGNIPITLSANLTPGKIYYLMVDSRKGDLCQFNISSNQVDTLPNTGNVQGPDYVHAGAQHIYSVPAVSGATSYTWAAPADALINGLPSPQEIAAPMGATVTITFGTTRGTVCVTPKNLCFTGKSACLEVHFGQTGIPPCPMPTPPGSESCNGACVVCGSIDGLTGINDGTPSGGNSVCGQIALHNDQWIGFIAGSTTIGMNINTSNCQNGDGLQVAIFEDCANDAITCNPGGGGGAGLPIELIYSNFVPGRTYFLMVDGWVGDVCNYQVDVFQGVTGAPSVGPITAPVGPGNICSGGTAIYQIPPVANAALYRWTAPSGSSINGAGNLLITTTNYVSIRFGNSSGQVCVNAANNCSTTVPACKTVLITPISPVVLPPVTICNSDLPYTLPWGVTVNASGNYQTSIATAFGCDSSVSQQVIVLPAITTNLPAIAVCAGETLEMCGNIYGTSGTYAAVCQAVNGCDSIIHFDLTVLAPVAKIQGGGNLNCSNNQVILSSAPSIGVKAWYDQNGQLIGSGNDLDVTQPGVYTLKVTETAGAVTCSATDEITISNNGTSINVLATDISLNCLTPSATITCTVDAPDPTFLWTGPNGFTSNQQNPVVTEPGDYQVMVTNPAGCSGTATVFVQQDITQPILTTTNAILNCYQTVGNLQVNANLPNTTFKWTQPNGDHVTGANLVVNTSGLYTVVGTAPNGCTAEATASVTSDLEAPTSTVNQVGLLGCGGPITLVCTTNAANPQFSWVGPQGFTSDLYNPPISLPGAYTVVVTNTDNGCKDSLAYLANLNTASDCASACVSCTGIDGYIGTNNGTPSGGNTVCGQIAIHNDQWFGFTAGTESITVNIATSNCENGDGLQIAFFENCSDDALVCNPGGGGGMGLPLELSYSSFIPGHTYYLMIDGWVADVCDYEIQILDGSTEAPDLGPLAAQPSGPSVICQGGAATYTVPEVVGASYYSWAAPAGSSINGQGNSIYTTGNSVEITFGSTSGSVCVRAGSACKTTPNIACLAVSVSSPQPTVLPVATVCSTELPYTLPWGTAVAASGVYQNTLASVGGCDSIVSQEVKVLLPIETELPAAVLCSGESVQVCGVSYANSGNYSVTCQSVAGCDSIINFSIQVLNPVAHILGAGSLNCATGPILLSSSASTGSKTWRKAGETQILSVGDSLTVSDPGSYILSVSQTLSGVTCAVSDTVDISNMGTEIGVITGAATLNCFTSPVFLSCSANTSDPVFVWSGPNNFSSNLQNPQVTEPGTYQVVVTNAQGCSGTAIALVNQDITPPNITLTNAHIDCAHPLDTLYASSTTPGTTFFWGNNPFGLPFYGSDLPVSQAGNYTVIAIGTNGCTNTATAVVTEDFKAPAAIIHQDGILGCGNVVILIGSSDVPTVQYQWTGPNGFSDTAQYAVVDMQGIYHLSVLNLNNGCSDTGSISVLQDNSAPEATITSYTNPVIGQNNGSIELSVPVGSNYSFQWLKNGITVAFTQNISNLGPGSYVCNVTGPNGCVVTLAIVLNAVTATQTPDENLQWKLFPNPSTGQFNIRCNSSAAPDALLNLYDASGRLCWTNERPQPAPDVLDFEHFPAGLYHLEIRTDKVVVQKKLEIIR